MPGFGRNGFGRNSERGFGRGFGGRRGNAGPEGICYCPKCGYERKKVAGVQCKETKCPKCGSYMLRKE